MRFLYCLLPLLGSAALAQELATTETCQCPQAKCPGNNTAVSRNKYFGPQFYKTD
jgi:hypothetical protein